MHVGIIPWRETICSEKNTTLIHFEYNHFVKGNNIKKRKKPIRPKTDHSMHAASDCFTVTSMVVEGGYIFVEGTCDLAKDRLLLSSEPESGCVCSLHMGDEVGGV